MDHSELRNLIDGLDRRINGLFVRRMEAVNRIAAQKRRLGLPVADEERERFILNNAENASEAYGSYSRQLFLKLIELSKQYQEQLIRTQAHKTMSCGLVGGELSYSFSKEIHAMLGAYEYELYSLDGQEMRKFFQQKRFDAVNVTNPYKRCVLEFCDEQSETVKRLGCANVIVNHSGRLCAHNTDYFGFMNMASKYADTIAGAKALVLGDGATGDTVCAVLCDLGASEVMTASRKGAVSFGDMDIIGDAEVIVNATPVGTDCAAAPLVDVTKFSRLRLVLDAVYNPYKTRLVLDAQAHMIPAEGGLHMLVYQAVKSSELFADIVHPPETAECILLRQNAQRNIALIGMPGCGKSAVGAKIAEMLGRKLLDLDTLIENRAGASVAEIFSRRGEAYFRKLESEIISECAPKKGCVIATGGGSVLEPENYYSLACNSEIYYLERAISKLPADGRPLSVGYGALMEMYKKRAPLYRQYAHSTISNNGAVLETANRIIEDFYENSCY